MALLARAEMSEVVLLFAGQGAQRVGMGRDLAESHPSAAGIFEKADAVLGRSLSTVMFDGPDDDLTRTANCQPALFVHGLALLDLLKSALPDLQPAGVAGLSLGEWTAHTAAGTFGFEEGLKLVARRGELMDEACAAAGGAMAAMIGGDPDTVVQLANDCDVDVANFNAPGQIVLSGPAGGIEQAVAEAKGRGIRIAKRLNVAGAYHSRLMQSAQTALAEALAAAGIGSPNLPVVSNFLARPAEGPDAIRDSLTAQVTGSVRWEESMRWFLERSHRLFIELGPGRVLAGLMGRIDPDAEVLTVEDLPSLEAALTKLRS